MSDVRTQQVRKNQNINFYEQEHKILKKYKCQTISKLTCFYEHL